MSKTLTLLFIGSLLLFVTVLPENHSEAEDAFEYSRLIEEGQGASLFHPHHLLYLPFQQGVFAAAKAFGYEGRAYHTARAVSMASGALAIGFFYLLACRIRNKSGSSKLHWLPVTATAGLLFSYGFLRYACEVEIYVPAVSLAVGALFFSLSPSLSYRSLFMGVFLASLALLTHTINVALALGVIPLQYWLIQRSKTRATVHLISTLLIVTIIYAWAYCTVGLYKPPLDIASEGGFRLGTLWKSIIGFGQCLLSANFIFAYDSIASTVQQMFPYRIFTEEVFATMYMPPWIKMLAPVTFVVTLLGLGTSFSLLVYHTVRRRLVDRTLVVLLAWLGGAMLPTMLLEPSNPELWILALPPAWSLLVWVAKSTHIKKALLLSTVILLGLHNLTAGMILMRNKQGDYHYAKAQKVLQEASASDSILTADSYIFSFYLNYWSDAKVINVNSGLHELGENTYVFDDVFNPPEALIIRYPEYAKNTDGVAKELQPKCVKLYDDQFGGVWMVESF